MEIRQLRTFIAVAETGSASRAAQLLHIVQPAVSRQLQSLEAEFGKPLFVRGRFGMRLTSAGETLALYARRAIAELDRASLEIRDTPVGGVVAIGLLPSTCDALSDVLVKDVSRLYPGIRLRLLRGDNASLKSLLETGNIDISLIYRENDSGIFDYSYDSIFREKIILVGRKEDGFSSHKPIKIEELSKLKFIFPSPGNGLRELFFRLSSERNIPLQIAVETNSMETQIQLVRAGCGITILPSLALSAPGFFSDLSIAVFEDPAFHRELVLARSIITPETVAAKCVREHLTSLATERLQDRIRGSYSSQGISE